MVIGQRVPVYPQPSSGSNKPPSSSGNSSPQVLRANIVISGGPLVHVIDRLNSRPLDSATLCDLQPAMAAMMAILSSAKMRSVLNGKQKGIVIFWTLTSLLFLFQNAPLSSVRATR